MTKAPKTVLVPAGRFGSHLSGLPAGRGLVRESLSDDAAARVPALHENHFFPAALYRDLIGWWNLGGAEPLLITGPAGSGKTSSVLQFAARLSLPVVVFTARPRMDRRELVGRWVMGERGMRWVDGPAALAWRNGWLLLVNEFSAAPAEAWVSANDLLEGLPLENDQTGEVIPRHPMARIIFTDNSRGHASAMESGYFGRQIQDRSVVDRMWHVRLEGLDEVREAELLTKSAPAVLVEKTGAAVAGRLGERLARAGAETRCSGNGSAIGFSNNTIALSHRALERMLRLMLAYAAGEMPRTDDPVAWAADSAVGNALDRPVRDALVTYLKTLFGDELEELRAACAQRNAGLEAQRRASTPDAGMFDEAAFFDVRAAS